MKKRIYQRKTAGFTLIELLVVTTIIIILSALGIVSYQNAGQNARNAKRQSDIETVRQALVLYRSDTGSYPVQTSFSTLVNTDLAGYISNPVPVDPRDGITACGSTGTVVCTYAVSSNATGFTLTAPLEGAASYTATNP